MAAEFNYLASYNSLLDGHLSEYLSRPAIWRHLRRQGLVRRSGEVVGEEEWRASVHRREARARVDRGRLEEQQERVAGNRKHRLQQNNYLLADKVRLQVETHHPGYVRERNFAPLSKADSRALGINRRNAAVQTQGYSDEPAERDQLREMLTSTHTIVRTNSNRSSSRSQSLVSTSARSVYRDSPYIPRPPSSRDRQPGPTSQRDPLVTEHIPSGLHRRRVIKSVNGGTPREQSRATVTLLYRGRGIRLSGRAAQESSDVCVYQQHCGGNAVQVFQGLLSPGSKFSFVSRRHLDSTLGLTFYLDGLADARVSACCEYRYRPGHGVGGGRGCHYEWVSVREATPCFRCQAEIEVDRFIAAGEPDRNSPKQKPAPTTGPREAWVNTSPLSGEDNETSCSESEEVTNAACGREDITAALSPTEGVSRRSSLSSESDATSSVTLDSHLNESQSEHDRAPYSSSLGRVTPDDRLLAPSALSGNPASICEEIEAVDSREQSPADCSEAANTIPVINLIGVDSTDLEQSPVDASIHSPNLSVSTDSGASNPGRLAPDSCDVSLSSESDSESEAMAREDSPYTLSDKCLTISRNLTDDLVKELVTLLQDNAINSLSIEDTRNFTPHHLTTILTQIQIIKSMRLSGNEISLDQLTIILGHLKHTTSLEISHSAIPPDHFGTFLKNLAKAAPNLTEFNASDCNIHFDQSITKLLNSLIHLKCLNLSRNVLKSAILFDSLHVPHLEDLRLDSTHLEESDLLALCRFMCGNATIHTLSLRDNLLSSSLLQKMLDMLQVNVTLKRLLFTAAAADTSQAQHINVKLISDILDKRAI